MTSKKLNGGALYTVPLSDIEYIGYFYGNKGKETVKKAYTRIKKLRGRAPDFLMNAELFDFNTRCAVSDVVSQGKVHKLTENYGIAFPENKTAVFCYKNNVKAADYVGAYPVLLRDGKATTAVPAGISGSRGRTALALDGEKIYIALVPDGKNDATLTELKREFISAGARDAINLDGGGSTQFYAPMGNCFSSRPVRGFIGIWVRGADLRIVRVRTNLNIRKGPGMLYGKIGKLYNGDSVTVLEERGGWSRISAGWVFSSYLVKI